MELAFALSKEIEYGGYEESFSIASSQLQL